MSFHSSRSLLVLLALFGWGVRAQAQAGGIRLILWNYELMYTSEGGDEAQHFGIGYDQDLTDRTSFGVKFRVPIYGGGWVLNYSSAFHFSSTENGSFYMGPNIGFRSLPGEGTSSVLPLGFRIGVRGGLERFYADLHAGYVYNVGGNGQVFIDDSSQPYDLTKNSFCFGLDLGWGWSHK